MKKDIRCLRVRKIWSDDRHNAFTSITGFKGVIFLAFRSASCHKAMDGAIRILRSDDNGESWQSTAFIQKENCDLRDPKIIEFNGTLHLFTFGRFEDGSFSSFHITSSDGKSFSQPEKISGMSLIWGIAKYDGRLYGTDYYRTSNANYAARLYTSSTGNDWEKLLDFPMPGTETAIDFDENGLLYAFIRDSGYGCGCMPSFVRLEKPYNAMPELDINTMDLVRVLPLRMVGPMIKRLKNACLLIGRCWDGSITPETRRNTRTDVYIMDDRNDPEFCFTLPSGGDTSYASYYGTAPGRALISYYSSHEHLMAYPLDDNSGRIAEHNTFADIFLAEISHNYC